MVQQNVRRLVRMLLASKTIRDRTTPAIRLGRVAHWSGMAITLAAMLWGAGVGLGALVDYQEQRSRYESRASYIEQTRASYDQLKREIDEMYARRVPSEEMFAHARGKGFRVTFSLEAAYGAYERPGLIFPSVYVAKPRWKPVGAQIGMACAVAIAALLVGRSVRYVMANE